jgi:hypothetical protein
MENSWNRTLYKKKFHFQRVDFRRRGRLGILGLLLLEGLLVYLVCWFIEAFIFFIFSHGVDICVRSPVDVFLPYLFCGGLFLLVIVGCSLLEERLKCGCKILFYSFVSDLNLDVLRGCSFNRRLFLLHIFDL